MSKIFPGRVYERRKPRKVIPHSIKSFYPRRENIWEYLNDDKAKNFDVEEKKARKKFNKQTLIKRSKSKNAKLLIFFLLALGLTSKYI